MFITHREENDYIIVEPEGYLDSKTSSDFVDYIDKLSSNGFSKIIISMEEISYISSEGIGATLIIQKKIQKLSGKVIFCNLNEEILKLFKILGFIEIFTIADSLSDAKGIISDTFADHSDRKTTMVIDRNLIFPEEQQRSDEENIKIDKPEPMDFSDNERELNYEEEDPLNKFETYTQEDLHSRDYMEEFIVECPKCSNLIKISASGDHLCPHCSSEFTVERSGRVLFKID